jgi:acetylornithine deacetylase/succinyl-diaminopimelate desuccinylase-like protein
VSTVTEEATDLLQHLIRNQCVNDGTPDSGHEVRSIDTLAAYLTAPGIEAKRYEPHPGRVSMVVRIEGTDKAAPSLHLCGHVDVVPVDRARWTRDPFAGELVDGTVWGRGAIDMLDETATMAVALRRLLDSGFRPKGTLIYSAVADEEAAGALGAEWLVENAWDDVRADYLLTEFGGARIQAGSGPARLPVMAGEKGSQWTRLRVKGTSGHGSMPYRSDNAAVKASEVIRRIAAYRPPARMHSLWLGFVDAVSRSAPQRFALTHGATLDLALARLPIGIARMFHACTHTTFSPNVARAGNKINVVPAEAEIDIDIRTLPGDEGEPVRAMLKDAIGDLWADCEITFERDSPPTQSSADTRLWTTLSSITEKLVPGARDVR